MSLVSENLEFVFRPLTIGNTEFCHDQAGVIADAINRYNTGSTGLRKRAATDDTTELPSSYQFILGAVEAPALDSDDFQVSPTPDTSPDGASILTVSIIFLLLMAVLPTLFI